MQQEGARSLTWIVFCMPRDTALISPAFTRGFRPFRRKVHLALAVDLEGAAGGGEVFDLDVFCMP